MGLGCREGASILRREQPLELGLGAGAARIRQPCALPLAVEALLQFLAHFLGAVACHRQLDQRSQ